MQIDDNLIKRCIDKDAKGQKQLYILLLPYLRAIGMRYLRNQSYIKDVLQESFVKIFRGLDHYDSTKARIEKWAGRIVINTAINYNNRIGTREIERVDNLMKEASVLPSVLESLSNEDMMMILKRMPRNYFEVFNLFIIDGYSHDEIGEILNISTSLSRKRLSRSRQWMKDSFTKYPTWLDELRFSI